LLFIYYLQRKGKEPCISLKILGAVSKVFKEISDTSAKHLEMEIQETKSAHLTNSISLDDH